MNKIWKYLVAIVFTFMISISFVNADHLATLDKDDIEGNTYIIGTHMFTSEVELNTKMIMLASKTISSNELSDMVIYYKDPFDGNWVDAITGTEVHMEDKIGIDYVNLKSVEDIVDPTVAIPELYRTTLNSSEDPNYKGIVFQVVSSDINLADGDTVEYQVYNSSSRDGQYTQLQGNVEWSGNWGRDENNDGKLDVFGDGYLLHMEDISSLGSFFKIKAKYTINGKVKYSDFSNVVELYVETPELYSVSPNSSEDPNYKGIVFQVVSSDINLADGDTVEYQVYNSSSRDGQYTQLQGNVEWSGNWGRDENNDGKLDVFGDGYLLHMDDISSLGSFFKIKAKYTINGKVKYSDFSNVVELYVETPELYSVSPNSSEDPNYKGIVFQVVSSDINLANGDTVEYQVYNSSSRDGQYTQLQGNVEWSGNWGRDENNDGKLDVFGDGYLLHMEDISSLGSFFKIKAKYTINGKVIYSDFSNVVELSQD